MEEIVFMAVRNCQASLLPPRALSKAATAHCIIVSFCHMMAMGVPRVLVGVPGVSFGVLVGVLSVLVGVLVLFGIS